MTLPMTAPSRRSAHRTAARIAPPPTGESAHAGSDRRALEVAL